MKRLFKWVFGLLLVAVIGIGFWGYAPDTDPAQMRAKYASAASRFVDVGGGLKMHVRDEGKRDGPALVLLHGSNSSLHTWEPWVKRLGAKYRIISLDQIGHGLTGPNPTGQYDAKAFVSTLDAVVTKLGVSRFALAGNSMGGWVAWNYAFAHPDKLSGLILVSSGGAPDAAPPALPIGYRLAQAPVIGNLTRSITPRFMVKQTIQKTLFVQAPINDAMIDRYWDLLRYPGNRAAMSQRFAVKRVVPTRDMMAKIKAPTFVMWGDRDGLTPVSAAHWFESAIPDAKKIIYNDVGHIPMEEAPDQSARDVDVFLAGLVTAKAP